MGRYYNGDIEGKFWFGVQSSNDADFFGSFGVEPNYLNYYFTKEDIPTIKEGVEKCLEKLGEYNEKLDTFFKGIGGYNDEMIAKQFKIKEDKVRELLEWYARLELGNKILKCVEENGSCEFEAEL